MMLSYHTSISKLAVKQVDVRGEVGKRARLGGASTALYPVSVYSRVFIRPTPYSGRIRHVRIQPIARRGASIMLLPTSQLCGLMH